MRAAQVKRAWLLAFGTRRRAEARVDRQPSAFLAEQADASS